MNSLQTWDNAAESRAGAEPPSKGLDQYVKALKRRFWIILLVGILVSAGGTAFTLYQSPVYWSSSRILIEPPRAIIKDLNEDRGGSAHDNFFNTRVEMITSRKIAERVLQSLQLSDWDKLNGVEDPVGELLGWIQVKPVKNSNLVDIGIEGADPKLVAKIVNTTVEEFLRYEQESLREFDQLSRSRVETELRGLEAMVGTANKALKEFHNENENFLLDGESVEAGRLAVLEEAVTQAELRAENARRTVQQIETMRASGIPWLTSTSREKIAALREDLRLYDEELEYQKSVIRPDRYDTDVAVRRLREKRDELEKTLNEVGTDDADYELQMLQQEIRFAEMDVEHLKEMATKQRKTVLAQQDEKSRLSKLRQDNERLTSLSDFISRRRLELEMRQGLVTPRIQVIDRATAPKGPIRPIKELQIPLFVIGGFFMGAVIVLLLELLDRTIREPEQAIATLDWPLIGVVPRMARRELVGRKGRHLLASEQPGSLACESFRNLRTGLLGAESDRPLRTLLVCSATPREGKSLIAANLAAACARAGESVLLIDADLRHPGLANFFEYPSGDHGLSEVLMGELPWPNALVQTPVDNLTVLPAGDAAGTTPDILGTAEMQELLDEMSKRYDRIILDAPALLGIADARVVGRFVDGAVVVVRAGTPNPKPLVRIKQVIEQEGLRPIGVVFNGIKENHADITNQQLTCSRPKRPRASRGHSKLLASGRNLDAA